MIEKRKAADRFRTRLDWLDSRHAFSFGAHEDPATVGHGALRVVNEDRIAGRSGFPAHSHRDMEILTYVLSGTLTHRDSEGNFAEIRPGRAQLMHAGAGISHSEMNRGREPVRLLQLWIEPRTRGGRAGYEMLDFEHVPGSPTVLASPDEARGGLTVRQDATVLALVLEADQSFEWTLPANHRGWIQVARGSGRVDAFDFEAGDGFVLGGHEALDIEAAEAAELLLFELPEDTPSARSPFEPNAHLAPRGAASPKEKVDGTPDRR